MNKKKEIGLVYSENRLFISKHIERPVNYQNIILSFQYKFGVPDLPIILRVIFSVVAFIFAILLILIALSILYGFINAENKSLSLINQLVTIGFFFVSVVFAYFFLNLAVKLLHDGSKKAKKSVNKLMKQGVILEGVIFEDYLISTTEIVLKYKFLNTLGTKLKGKYHAMNLLEEVPTNVAVWYADDETHTLL